MARVTNPLTGAIDAGRRAARRMTSRGEDGGSTRGSDRDVHVVTVNRPVGDVLVDGRVPPPLDELGDAVEVTVTPAPGARGTELRARLVHRVPSHVTLPDAGDGEEAGRPGLSQSGAVRKALREAKMLLETGEILLPDGPPTTTPTPLNAPLRSATAHGRDGGRL